VRETEMAFGGSGQPRVPSPYERGLDFCVPRLCVRENGALFEFESTFLLEHPWKLSTKDAMLADDYSPLLRPMGKAGLLDIGARGEVIASPLQEKYAADFIATLHQQVLDLGGISDWSLENLVAWLDRHIDHQDIPLGESAAYLRKVVRGLMARFDITDVSTLALDRFRLRDEVEIRINQHRQAERRAAFQAFLLPQSELTVSDEYAINFRTMGYEPSWLYEGAFTFPKHYFGPKPGELRELTPGGKLTEEFRCARFIEDLPEVDFWVRNLAQKATSLRLHTASDWFYPDFVCQLKDGRALVVEYKGKDRYTAADAEDKRTLGAVWASRSNGRCLFVMPTDTDFSTITREIKNG
jgi:type III restriction enzyme